MQFTVHVTRGISTLLTILPGEALFLGRDSGQCQYILRDSSVSRRHCKLSVFGDKAWVEDLGSTNGTWVNGERTENALLSAGDVVAVGHVTREDDQVRPGSQSWPGSCPVVSLVRAHRHSLRVPPHRARGISSLRPPPLSRAGDPRQRAGKPRRPAPRLRGGVLGMTLVWQLPAFSGKGWGGIGALVAWRRRWQSPRTTTRTKTSTLPPAQRCRALAVQASSVATYE